MKQADTHSDMGPAAQPACQPTTQSTFAVCMNMHWSLPLAHLAGLLLGGCSRQRLYITVLSCLSCCLLGGRRCALL